MYDSEMKRYDSKYPFSGFDLEEITQILKRYITSLLTHILHISKEKKKLLIKYDIKIERES